MRQINNSGQVWIETVIYTLIGLSLIALVLAFITPKINEGRDQAVVGQTINSLNQFDEKIRNVLQAPGNSRLLELLLKRGDFIIDGKNDQLIFVIDDLSKPYSEPGVQIDFGGRIKILSEEGAKTSNVSLRISYSDINLTYNGQDIEQRFNPTSVPYKFVIKSNPIQNGYEVVDIREVSGG